MGDEPTTIPEQIGQRVREIREAAGRSQDECAAAAQAAGLNWTRGAVAALETGRRGLSAEEFLLLPTAMVLLDGADHTLAELFDFNGPMIELANNRAIGPRTLRLLVQGRPVKPSKPGWQPGILSMAQREAERHAARLLGVSPEQIASAALKLWGRGLTEEREDRIDIDIDALEGGMSSLPRALQAARGHVTRELLADLQAALKKEDGDG